MPKIIDTRSMPVEVWRVLRRQGIGGSDAAAIVGLNPYVTPYSLWADKTGRLPEKEETEAMRQGRDLEEYVATRFTEKTGKKVRRRNVMFVHDDLPFVIGNIDREVVGESAGLECKTTSVMNLKKFKNGEFPDQYYVQCVHYLAVTGFKKWYLAVLVLNQGFYVYEIKRDEAEIAALLEAEKEFWETYVVSDIAPAVDGFKPTTEALAAIYQGGGDSEIMPVFRESVLTSYVGIKQQIKALEHEKEKCEQIIKEDLKDAELGQCGPFDISWKPQTRRTFDAAAFSKEYPEMDLSGFYKSSTFRVFKVSERKAGGN